MKAAFHLGRRQLLALSALGLLPVSPLRTLKSLEQSTASADSSLLRVHIKDGSNVYSSLYAQHVSEVRAVLQVALQLNREGGSPTFLLRKALSSAYPTQMSEAPLPPEYIWVWNGEEWVRYCFDVHAFEVDFGSDVVVSEIADNRRLGD